MASRILLRALHLGFLLAAAAVALTFPGHRVSPGWAFTVLAVYAHAAARLLGAQGPEKAAVFLEVLPFFGFAVAFFGWMDPFQGLQTVAAGIASGAAILAIESWFVKGSPTFGSSLGFIGACALAGLGLAMVSPWLVLGPALLLWLGAGYGLARGRA